jgi:DNA-binding NarL/FixJ family response regulator
VFVVDDQYLVRTGLRTLAEHDRDIRVVAEVANVPMGSPWYVSTGPMWC